MNFQDRKYKRKTGFDENLTSFRYLSTIQDWT